VKGPWLLIAIAGPILAQDPPTPPPVINLRPLDLSFKDVQLPGRPKPFTFNPAMKLELREKPPNICSIPLLQVVPKGNYTLKVVKPREAVPAMPEASVPAPACEGQNR
jgi:hypothetical protein